MMNTKIFVSAFPNTSAVSSEDSYEKLQQKVKPKGFSFPLKVHLALMLVKILKKV